ncbi:MAG: hypothetical protein KIT67_13610 [Alphaproteobacteria bacterium]|nr:hypothetical protein [Alphaproteobacteria bacterium]
MIALVLIVGILGVVIWSMARRPKPGEQPQPRNATPEEIEGYAVELRDRLDRRPFGEQLVRDVWRRLMGARPDSGVIYEYHRDFCGQGLIRTAKGVKLCDVQDGGAYFGEPIAQWFEEEEFVAFLARQSDYSCSGWDESEPVFFTTDSWYRNNQRLTRAVLERYRATGG